ncbi:RHS repeat protein [Pantoea sp. Tr-811]|uniref:RHS repeat domain-containing protein n=1 Tax=Pantoea sp. Tr-811 TaxID=2608361 RepID=UPI001420D678|nr:RHS repeat protein [Pantoea sp. Tr-811]NIF30286.1 RHS repeat protein [Pantoea sp. Tr-811]
MAASTAISSNAFNFLSYLRGGVDPRTGQYTLAVDLPDIKANHLQGPDLPLDLSFNPLNQVDSGYGMGWDLKLSHYAPRSNVMTLNNGETFAVTSTEQDAYGRTRLVMKEQKVESFRLYDHGAGRYRVEHRSGMVEILAPKGAQGVCVPVQVFGALGHGVTLEYAVFAGYPRLEWVRGDDGEPLLHIDRPEGGNAIKLLVYPDGIGGSHAEYALRLGANALVERISLPTHDELEQRASWRIKYVAKDSLHCVESLQTPVGGEELLFYTDGGHRIPDGSGLTRLPRVNQHLIRPGFGQPEQDVRYTYPNDPANPVDNNFLGYGLNIDWSKNKGQDALYQYIGDYSYGSVETHYQADVAVRSIERRFNQFHLQTLEKTRQGKAIKEVVTTYKYKQDVAFEQQESTFQLPHEVTTRWWVEGAGGQAYAEVETFDYDEQGNPTKHVKTDGITEINEWYLPGKAEGHPEDKSGFIRHLNFSIVTPAEGRAGKAAEVVRRYAYITLPALTGEVEPAFVPGSETLEEETATTPVVWQSLAYSYHEDDSKPWQYGRMLEKVLTMGKLATTSHYDYAVTRYVPKGQPHLGTVAGASPRAGETVLQTVETLTGHDGVQKVITTEHSLLHDLPLLTRDDNDVEIRYEYDPLRRTTREMVAPGTPFEASRRYAYVLCAKPGDQASQTAFDVKDVQTLTLVDGLNRPIKEQRLDMDNLLGQGADTLHDTYEAQYDALGQLVSETQVDWLNGKPLKLATTFEYDDWGEQQAQTGPDGVTQFTETTYVNDSQHQGKVTTAWRIATSKATTGKTITWYDAANNPVKVERLDAKGTLVSRALNAYDGLGRAAKETVGIDSKTLRVEEHLYDVFGRQVTHTLGDKNKVVREYALHSEQDLPTLIKVPATKDILLGTQTFDGLGRLETATTGGRLQKYEYDPGQTKPARVYKYKQDLQTFDLIHYEYNPVLSEEPTKRYLAGAADGQGVADIGTATYGFDPKKAWLVDFEVQGQKVNRTYFSTGEVKTETRDLGEEKPYTMSYRSSLQSRAEGYTDVLGQEQSYDYDAFGRLQATQLAGVASTFTYDAFGRMASYTTREGGRSLATTLTYDDFEREQTRTFDFGDVKQTLTQRYDDFDGMVQRTLDENGKVLRDEHYKYDARGRLVTYICKGENDQSMPLEPPQDAWGNKIYQQDFSFDAIDNITLVTTTDLDKKVHRTVYEFKNTDPAQLSAFIHVSAGGAQPKVTLEYDDYGNMTKDDEGRTLAYDALNRLVSVDDGTQTQSYAYDAKDVLTGTSQ